MITYRILPSDPSAHLYRVSLLIPEPNSAGQIVQLPAWIPGSYLIREFARHIIRIEAFSKNRKINITKIDKHTWQIASCIGPVHLEYDIYAWDTSVRSAYLDERRGFFNGSSVFLSVVGQTHQPCLVDIHLPAEERYQSWNVMTTLREHKAERYGFGLYIADNYDELIDHPVEMGHFTLGKFAVCGTTHEIAISGTIPNLDLTRLTRDLAKICAAHIKLFEPHTLQAPVKRYAFLVHAIESGYGGLEHRASTALLCSRHDLPVQVKSRTHTSHNKNLEKNYRQFLGLCSHEYFHMWHIKRIKPAAFVPYDLQRENYTRLLWLFEGFTSYYDDLMLFRSGVIELNDYLEILAKTIFAVQATPGRFKQTLAESSFDAWIKYYRPDENSINSTVSYYTKGALVALALDLTIRQASHGSKSLDDVMRALWQQFGHDFYNRDEASGLDENQTIEFFNQATGLKLDPWLNYAIDSTRELPLAALLEEHGFTLTMHTKQHCPSLGVRVKHEGPINVLAQVYSGKPAQQAGLAAGDILVAIEGIRIHGTQLETLLSRYQVGDLVDIHVFRHDELRLYQVKLGAPEADYCSLTPISGKRQSIGAWPAALSN
jgi:predicted metalloprotease with PDZ domain